MKRFLLSVTACLLSFPAFAIDKIYEPYVEEGEFDLEYFGHRSRDGSPNKNNAQVHEYSFEYGVNRWWQTELYGIWQKDAGDDAHFYGMEWENIFQLTRKGEYWVDIGATFAYEWTPQEKYSDTLEMRLLLTKNFSTTSHTFNFIAEKEVAAGPKDSLETGVMWSSRYHYRPYFEPGFEIHSEFGEVSDAGSFDNQEHYIGPVAYGIIPIENAFGAEMEGIKYRAGYLFGASNAAADGQMVLQFELEF